jgi:hypothetical protein
VTVGLGGTASNSTSSVMPPRTSSTRWTGTQVPAGEVFAQLAVDGANLHLQRQGRAARIPAHLL